MKKTNPINLVNHSSTNQTEDINYSSTVQSVSFIMPTLSTLSIPQHGIVNNNTHKKKSSNGTTDPIRDLNDIQACKDYFLSKPTRYKNNPINIRNYTLFVLTINCARRIGDMLQLKVKDVMNPDWSFKYYIGFDQSKGITEQKTGKQIRIPLNEAAKEALWMYIKTFQEIDLEAPLFPSRKPHDIAKAQAEYDEAIKTNDQKLIKYKKVRLDIAKNFTNSLEPRAVSTIIKDMSKAVGLEQRGININTHSLRKTKGYHVYQQTHDIQVVSKMLNHSKEDVTKRYIGIAQDEINKAVLDVNL